MDKEPIVFPKPENHGEMEDERGPIQEEKIINIETMRKDADQLARIDRLRGMTFERLHFAATNENLTMEDIDKLNFGVDDKATLRGAVIARTDKEDFRELAEQLGKRVEELEQENIRLRLDKN